METMALVTGRLFSLLSTFTSRDTQLHVDVVGFIVDSAVDIVVGEAVAVVVIDVVGEVVPSVDVVVGLSCLLVMQM